MNEHDMRLRKKDNGFTLPAILAVAVGIFVLGGVIFFNTKPEEEIMMEKGALMRETGEKMMEDGEAMVEAGEKMMEDGETKMDSKEDKADSMMEDNSSMEQGGDAMMSNEPFIYTSAKIAGTEEAPLLEFNQADYNNAVASGKLVTLYFYANWCPTCKKEFPEMESAFNALDRNDVVGFRVHYRDDEITPEAEALAREHGVPYQHTKVFIKNGERLLKSPESWDKNRYINEINEFAG